MKKQTLNLIIIFTTILCLLAITPFLIIARTRSRTSPSPKIHLFRDMDSQPKFRAQQTNPLFRDNRQMRLPVANTLAVEDVASGPVVTGKMDGEWLTAIPIPVDVAFMKRGQERYAIYCATCHGLSGYGDGITALRADELMEVEASKWVPPTSYHADTVLERPVGHLFNTITNGIRTMPPYRAQIAPRDRWAIVAYIRALQRSQNATIEDVPPDMRSALQ